MLGETVRESRIRKGWTQAHLARMKTLEEAAKRGVKVGMEPPLAARAARCYVADAKVGLAEAKGE